MEKEKLCLRCMRKIGDNDFCPYCRKENSEPQKAPFLPLKTVVGGRYLVGKLVASNSEGSTYYAFDLEKKTPVTLRELFPKGIVLSISVRLQSLLMLKRSLLSSGPSL